MTILPPALPGKGCDSSPPPTSAPPPSHCRPATREPASVAVVPGVLSHLGALLDRHVAREPAGMHARDALIAPLG